MRNSHPRYMCFPSVVCVGKQTEVYIRPRDISRIFRSEQEYELGVVGLRDDQLSYHDKVPLDHDFEIKDGCLVFKHTFSSEQEYSIRFCKKGQKEERITLYAVEEDLYTLRPLKGDLHTHTYYSDGADGVAMTPANYREEGYDFFSLTDHNRMYTSRLAAELYDGIPLGMHIMSGEEVHPPESILHIVHAGGRASVCSKYINNRDEYEKEIDKISETLLDVDEKYRRRVAMAKWTCNEIHKAGGLSILPHPFWCPNRYNLSKELLDYIYDNNMFDALEVIGGIPQAQNNFQLALWQEKSLQGKHLNPVASSDSHDHDISQGLFGKRFTIVFAKENSTEAIVNAVKDGYCVASEIPVGDDKEARFYGSLRLVLFSQFLHKTYFLETQKLCFGEGVLMRRYAEGEDVKELLSSLADTVCDFYKKFYGITAPAGLSSTQINFLDKALEAQRKCGPETCGSSLYFYGTNANRE